MTRRTRGLITRRMREECERRGDARPPETGSDLTGGHDRQVRSDRLDGTRLQGYPRPDAETSETCFLSRRMAYTPRCVPRLQVEAVIASSDPRRQNLSMRMSVQRFTRPTKAFSKKLENHAVTVALHFVYYNFGRVHQTLRVTPSMKAGIAEHVWSGEGIVALLDEALESDLPSKHESHPVAFGCDRGASSGDYLIVCCGDPPKAHKPRHVGAFVHHVGLSALGSTGD
jgi:hypothetical protein